MCRGRRVVENAFGLLSARWRIFLKPIETRPAVVDNIVTACCALHNFIIDEGPSIARLVDAEGKDGQWRKIGEMQQAEGICLRMHNRAPNAAMRMRQTLMEFYNEEGSVDWQEKYLNQY